MPFQLDHLVQKIKGILSPVWLLDNELNLATKTALIANVEDNSNWLDVGCGLKPFSSCFDRANYIGIDIQVSGRSDSMKIPDKYFDGISIPYEDDTFDGIICTQVLEHVEQLDLLLRECNRVLKLKGVFLISVPFLFREHEQPFDFRRFTSYGLKLTLQCAGFRISSSVKCLSAIETIATVFSVYVANNLGIKNKFIHVMSTLFLVFPSLLLSKILAKHLPDNRDLFCCLVVCGVKVKNLKG